MSAVRAMARALDDAALEALASRGLVRRAAADVAAGRASVLAEDAASATVRVEGETARILAKGPRAGACSCPAPGVCRHRLAALILLREAGPGDAADDERALTPACPAADPAAPAVARARKVPSEAAPPDPAVLAAVREGLERAYRTALAFAPQALESDIRRLAVAGRVEALPRLAAALRRLAGAFAPLRARRAEADPETVLTLIAETYALTVALTSPTDAASLQRLAGQVRQDYAPLEDVTLTGLGAKLWTSPAGGRGVTAYFQAEGRDEAFTVTHARGDQNDVGFDPARAFRQAPVWGSTLERLCAAQGRLSGGRGSASGRLSPSFGSLGAAAAWTPSPEAVQDWDCVHADWAGLEAWLRPRLAGSLVAPAPWETPVVLAFSGAAPARFDALGQTLIWPLADRQGRWIGLTLPHEGAERRRIAALEGLLGSGRSFWAVLATAQADEGGIALRPYGLWGEDQRLLDFPEAPRGGAMAPADESALMARFRAAPPAGPGEPRGLIERRPHADRLIDRGWALVLRGADGGGGAAVSDALVPEARSLASQFAAAGLSPLARPFAAAAETPRAAGAWIRAAWAVVSARRLRARLPWMR
jgi:hypothetical protein